MKPLAHTILALTLLGPSLAKGEFIVMTQNQYLGADLVPIIAAAGDPEFDPIVFNDAVLAALIQVAANDFVERADALAALIADRSPHVVGLQEVFRFTCTDVGPPAPGLGCDDPSVVGAFNDHLILTTHALDDLLGADSYVVPEDRAIVWNLDLRGIPVYLYGIPGVDLPDILIDVLDRDVILVRGDLAEQATVVPFSDSFPFLCMKPSVDPDTGIWGPGCNYQAVVPIPELGISIERGYVGIDIWVDGLLHRVVNTHLEVRRPNGQDNTLVFQALQAFELIQTLQLFPNPENANVVVLGDINSAPEDPIVVNTGPAIPPFDVLPIIPPYTQFVSFDPIFLGGGYTDAWTLRPGANGRGKVQGLSCCQSEDLSNRRSSLFERIDMIFTRDAPIKVKKARILGGDASDRTPPPGQGIWPSDHGSVAAELQFD